MKPPVISHNLNKHNNLAEFIVDPANRLPYEIATYLANHATSEYNPTVFYGLPRSGKTHLMQAIKNSIEEKFPDHGLVYIEGREFCEIFNHSLKQAHYQQFRELCRCCQCFFLEDFHLLRGKQNPQRELLFIINELQQTSRQMVFSSQFPLKISGFSHALVNRLQNGLSLTLQPLSKETVLGYCRERANIYKINLEEQAIEMFWSKYPGTFGEFKLLIHKLFQFLAIKKQKLTLSMIENWLDAISTYSNLVPDFEKILNVVGEYFHLDHPHIMCEKAVPRYLVIPRYLAISLSREVLHMDMENLKEHFGQLSSSAIRNALKTVRDDSSLCSILKELRNKIAAPDNRLSQTD